MLRFHLHQVLLSSLFLVAIFQIAPAEVSGAFDAETFTEDDDANSMFRKAVFVLHLTSVITIFRRTTVLS